MEDDKVRKSYYVVVVRTNVNHTLVFEYFNQKINAIYHTNLFAHSTMVQFTVSVR